ncbi:MAG: DUF4214 domain-containing protein [Pseudomonadota bacterium]
MYEQTESFATATLTASTAEGLTSETIAEILKLTAGGSDNTVSFDTVAPASNGVVTVAAGTEVVFINTSSILFSNLTFRGDSDVIVFQGAGGVGANIGSGAVTVASGYGVVDRIVVGSAGKDLLTFAGMGNNYVTVGNGDTVVAGGGADTIVAGFGNSTVKGGTGFEVIKLGGAAADYGVTVINGRAVVTNIGSGIATDIDGVQFIQLGNGETIVLAQNALEAAVTTLYEATFGRTADASGLGYWFDLARSGVALDVIAEGFVNSAEYQSVFGGQSDTDFMTNLFLNTFGRAASAAEIASWTTQLSAGTVLRSDVLAEFAETAGNNIAGLESTEANIVGTVIIVPGIFG